MNDSLKCTDCGELLISVSKAGICAKCLMQLGFDSQHGPAKGTTMNESENSNSFEFDHSRLTQLFPELEIQKQLGKGGMGIVILATQRNLDRQVALKVLRSGLAEDPSFSERFTREARALAKLNHPAIIGVHDFGQREDVYYFIMEYVNGSNLRHIVQSGSVRPAEALAIVPQICDALQYAHDEGVVHRDIKPENILIDQKGRVKIADFGLAKIVGTENNDFTLTGTHQVMGTPHYMAPEQMERPSEVDHRADIYSLGVVFYEMLTGELPLGRFAPPSKKVEINVRLDEVVMRALAKEPELRYQQVTEVKTQVEKIGDGEPLASLKDRALDRVVNWANAASNASWPETLESAKATFAKGSKKAAEGLGAAKSYGSTIGSAAVEHSETAAKGWPIYVNKAKEALHWVFSWLWPALVFAAAALIALPSKLFELIQHAWVNIRMSLVTMVLWTILCTVLFVVFGFESIRRFGSMDQWQIWLICSIPISIALLGNMLIGYVGIRRWRNRVKSAKKSH